MRNAKTAYWLIRESTKVGMKIVLSLDHDLGDDEPTGYDLLNWIEKDIATEENFYPDILFYMHSANPVGRMNMQMAIRAIKKLLS